jgi:MYXO-CTERM domain-containing protein
MFPVFGPLHTGSGEPGAIGPVCIDAIFTESERDMKQIVSILSVAALAGAANANIRITEWMYSGGNGEFIEFTNVGASAIDMSGWSYDDDSRLPGGFDLSGFGLVAAGQSVVITESEAEAFRTAWSLSASVQILGGVTNNLGRNDEINLFDSNGDLVDRLTYGDQAFAGSIRTQNFSGNVLPEFIGANNVLGWVLSASGDIQGSFLSSGGDLGNPGGYVIPAPGAMALLGLGGLVGLRRRR